ncbi:inorganic diphosphatase [Nannochloropsis gaditana]|uniref:inorganic diphosphatase n=1 Tax=Nannochloropsis gaditana TaxID=72520 RepID=W7TSC5_9STRA|nr:inorganic diphosphatase [Nannochloropsis gaditana]
MLLLFRRGVAAASFFPPTRRTLLAPHTKAVGGLVRSASSSPLSSASRVNRLGRISLSSSSSSAAAQPRGVTATAALPGLAAFFFLLAQTEHEPTATAAAGSGSPPGNVSPSTHAQYAPVYDIPIEGKAFPGEVPVFIEVSKGSRMKYEWDSNVGLLRLDRVLHSAVFYPFDYGFIPQTLCDDGDPLDVLVMGDSSLEPGCIVDVRVLGYMVMEDEKGKDENGRRSPSLPPSLPPSLLFSCFIISVLLSSLSPALPLSLRSLPC